MVCFSIKFLWIKYRKTHISWGSKGNKNIFIISKLMWKRRGTKKDYIETNQVEPNICCKNLIFFILKHTLMNHHSIKRHFIPHPWFAEGSVQILKWLAPFHLRLVFPIFDNLPSSRWEAFSLHSRKKILKSSHGQSSREKQKYVCHFKEWHSDSQTFSAGTLLDHFNLPGSKV